MKLDAVKDVTVPVTVVLGENRIRIEDLHRMGEGSIVELTSIAGEPVELYASGEKVAEGEVVIIDENFGLRITKLSDEGGRYAGIPRLL
ncbi:flagellar motor switch protein FliN [Salinispira pacifica]|uniref:Flagellar motor switch protein FliN n=1 Tax=Salinispira pacifica TaxID=1307761 RepID=V5WK29_9SPIO|nr:flagellar motor switch protein FliN [Salinispira pacifica]AHC16098.1 Flagellar motor switch protein FliN [Salinispira pacifica]